MISFVAAEDFFSAYPVLNDDDKSIVSEYISDACGFDGFDVAFACCHGAFMMRYYSEDAGYHFEAPIPLSGECDFSAAYAEISEYCKAQSVQEIVVGVPPEHKEMMLRGAERYNVAEDEDGSLVVEILTECMLLDDIPEVMCEDLYLGEFALSYASEYEKLIKNVNLNRYFGYNITDDLPDGNGVDFIKLIRDDFDRSESITLAATVMSENGGNVFVGEGTLYAFDGRGGASLSFRVLPEYHGRGFGKKIFAALFRIAEQIGVHTLFAEVMRENAPSLHILESYSAPAKLERGKYKFIFDVKAFVK